MTNAFLRVGNERLPSSRGSFSSQTRDRRARPRRTSSAAAGARARPVARASRANSRASNRSPRRRWRGGATASRASRRRSRARLREGGVIFPGPRAFQRRRRARRRLGVAEAQDHRRGSRGLAGGEVGGFARRAPGDEGSRSFPFAPRRRDVRGDALAGASRFFVRRFRIARRLHPARRKRRRRREPQDDEAVVRSGLGEVTEGETFREPEPLDRLVAVLQSRQAMGHASVSARRRQRHLDAGFAPPDVDSEARITRQRHVEQRARLHDERPHAHGVEVERLRRGPRRHQRRALWWTPCVFSERSEQQRSSLVRGVLRFVGIRVSRNQIAVTLTRHSDARGVRVGFPRGIRP